LAKLLRGRIRFENGDFAGAAAILNSKDFQQKTNVADYALWLRGRALLFARDVGAAGPVFQELIENYPESIRVRDARIGWATDDLANTNPRTAEILADLLKQKDPEAFIVMGRGAEGRGEKENAVRYYRAAYFGARSGANDPKTHLVVDPASEAATKLKFFGDDVQPREAEEFIQQAEKYLSAKNYAAAAASFSDLAARFPTSVTAAIQLRRVTALANAGRMPDAQAVFSSFPESLKEREEGFRQLVLGYAKAKLWAQARSAADEMRQKFPAGRLTPATFVDAGYAARDAKNKGEETYFLTTALTVFPTAIEVAGAQFELAWLQHENGNFAESSRMFIEHLARYAEKDTTNRGKAGYWAARDSERAGKAADACALYEGVSYRYSANWYGHIGLQRLTALKNQGQCRSQDPAGPLVPKAVASLRSVTVAAETSTPKELERAEKGQQLSVIGLFDWAIDELEEAKKTANNSPKINMALAQHFRLKGNNVAAFTALRASYPDYSQMFPEEMGRAEWDIFYPHIAWDQIAAWAKNRNLDLYQVAGLIRQESVFDPRAKSPAKAYGLMQLILPTAQSVARKYGSTATISVESLFLPALNIELGTAYMRDQLDKFGRIEYVAVAYNAGPGRVPQWRSTLPIEIDEFVEEIPFKETKAYVQGVIRNSAQYRRLYDENGNFKPNVGTRPLRGEIDSKTRDQIAAEFPDVVVDIAGE
jgi:soluble lytic murein transglycosylase